MRNTSMGAMTKSGSSKIKREITEIKKSNIAKSVEVERYAKNQINYLPDLKTYDII